MCGASGQQTQIANAQQAFYTQAIQQQNDAWSEDQDILNQMKAAYEPIFAKGPSQTGFSAPELTSMQTEAGQGTAVDYAQAAKVAGEQTAAIGGGDMAVPTGVGTQTKAQIAAAAAGQQSTEQAQITQANWQQGYQNWLAAASGMGATAGMLNPVNYTSAATGAGSAAATSANQIAQENNSWLNAAIGAAGSIGTGLIGANPGGIFGP